jgi:multimeric flavodoxin WrbA
MRMLGIYGSPRKNGNTDLMLDAFLEGAAEGGGVIERLYVRDSDVRGCLGCGHCDRAGSCIQKDDMVDIYPLLDSADRIVIAAPIYFYGVPGQLKLLIDRSQAPFMKMQIQKAEVEAAQSNPNRRGFLLSAGATRGKRVFECAILSVKYFFDALGIEYAGDLCFREIDERGAIKLHATALDDCRTAGREFAGIQV